MKFCKDCDHHFVESTYSFITNKTNSKYFCKNPEYVLPNQVNIVTGEVTYSSCEECRHHLTQCRSSANGFKPIPSIWIKLTNLLKEGWTENDERTKL